MKKIKHLHNESIALSEKQYRLTIKDVPVTSEIELF
jgi:hypothetical protein